MIVARITLSRDGHTILNHSLRTDLIYSSIFFIKKLPILPTQNSQKYDTRILANLLAGAEGKFGSTSLLVQILRRYAGKI